jgi:predicted methyltransferase
MKMRTLIGMILLVALGACSEKPKVLPENATIYEKAVANTIRPKSDTEDDENRKPTEILAFSGIKPEMTVVDLFAGSGYYTELFSHIVGSEGKIYFHNSSMFLNSKEDTVVERLKSNRLPNVVRLDSDFADLQLPSNADLIFLGKIYHDIYVPRDNPAWATDRENFFRQIRDALKPGGKVLLIDHNGEPGSGNSKTAALHRIDEHFAKSDFEAAGFKYIDQLATLRNPNDDLSANIWDAKVRGNTDRFIYLFEAP